MSVFNWDVETGSLTPDTCEFGITYNTIIHSSPLSGTVQTMEMPGARWKLRLSFRDLAPAEGRKLAAFLAKLRGGAGRFYCYDFGRIDSSVSPNTETYQVAAVVSSSEITLALLGGGTPVDKLGLGDYISIGNDSDRELKMITYVPPSGNTYGISPKLRKPSAEYVLYTTTNKQISYKKALGVFMLSSDEQAKWTTRTSQLLTDIDIDAVEVFLKAGV